MNISVEIIQQNEYHVIRKEVPYDAAFSDELTELDISIARDQDYTLVRLSVLELPYCSSDCSSSFLSSKYTLTYNYAE